jgi:hypothetical protein
MSLKTTIITAAAVLSLGIGTAHAQTVQPLQAQPGQTVPTPGAAMPPATASPMIPPAAPTQTVQPLTAQPGQPTPAPGAAMPPATSSPLTAPPAAAPTPTLAPVSPTYPTPAPVTGGVNPAPQMPLTAPPQPLPPTMSDAELQMAGMMLDRIEVLTHKALHETETRNADSAHKIASDGNSGELKVDRATLDEIQALAGQVAAMIPTRHQQP